MTDVTDKFAKNAVATKDAELTARIFASFYRTLREECSMPEPHAARITELYFQNVIAQKK